MKFFSIKKLVTFPQAIILVPTFVLFIFFLVRYSVMTSLRTKRNELISSYVQSFTQLNINLYPNMYYTVNTWRFLTSEDLDRIAREVRESSGV